MASTIRIEGLKGVMDTLRSLPQDMISGRGNNPIQNALKESAILLQQHAQALLQANVEETAAKGTPTPSTGLLKRQITVLKRRRGAPGEKGIFYSVGIRRSSKAPRGEIPSHYAWFLELGTEKMEPHPFMRPTYDLYKGEAVAHFASRLTSAVNLLVAQAAARNGVRP